MALTSGRSGFSRSRGRSGYVRSGSGFAYVRGRRGAISGSKALGILRSTTPSSRTRGGYPSVYSTLTPLGKAAYWATRGMSPSKRGATISAIEKSHRAPETLTAHERELIRPHLEQFPEEFKRKFYQAERKVQQAAIKTKVTKMKESLQPQELKQKRIEKVSMRAPPTMAIPGVTIGLLYGAAPFERIKHVWKDVPTKIPTTMKLAVATGPLAPVIVPTVAMSKEVIHRAEPSLKRYEAFMGEQIDKVSAHPMVEPFKFITPEYIEATPEEKIAIAVEHVKKRPVTKKEKTEIQKAIGVSETYRKLFMLPSKLTKWEEEGAKFQTRVATGRFKEAEEQFAKQISEPVSIVVGGERAKAISKQEKKVREAYEEGAYETYKKEQRELAALPLPSPARQFGRGIAETLITIPIAPLFIGRVAAETAIAPTAAPGKAKKFVSEYYKFAIKEPYRVSGQAVTLLATGRVGKALKAKAYEMPTRIRGVKPYTGEPPRIGKLFGEKYHPTLAARPFSKAELKAGIFEAQEPYFHGTSLPFVEQIKRTGKMEVSPGAKITDIERSLFFGAPRRPYLAFATPTKIARVKVSEIKSIPAFKKYIPEKATAKSKIDIPYSEYVEVISKRIDKPSPELIRLIKTKKSIESAIRKEVMPRKRMALEARKSRIEQSIQEQQIREVGIASKIVEKPGAFLEWETTPKRPSKKLQKKIFELESFTERLEKGTQSERAIARKYRDIIEKTRFMYRLEKAIPKYEAAKKAVRAKRRETLTQEEFERMSQLKMDIETLSKREIEKGKLVVPAKAIKGYKWKGREEWEYTAAPGTVLYPVETLRTRMYSMLGIEKGAYKIYDPISQQFVEVLKVTTEKAKRPREAPIIDVGEAYRAITERKPKKLTAKEYGQIAKLRAEVEKARKSAKYDEVSRLESRIRRIKYKPRERKPKVLLADREARIRVERPTLDIRSIERAYHEFDIGVRGAQHITEKREHIVRVPTERPRELIERPRISREAPRVERLREVERPKRTERRKEIERVEEFKRIEKPKETERIYKEIVTFETYKPTIEIIAIPKLIIEPKRKKRPTPKKSPYAWKVRNPIPELQEMFSKEMQKRRIV